MKSVSDVSDEEVRRTAEPDVELFAVSPRGATITDPMRRAATVAATAATRNAPGSARRCERVGFVALERDRGLVLDEVRRVPASLVLCDLRGARRRRVQRAEEHQRAERTRAEEARRRAPEGRAPLEMRALHASCN